MYTVPGAATITATVTDDDGGLSQKSFTITALSLEDAIENVANQLASRTR